MYRPPYTSDGRMLLKLPNKYRHDIVVTLNSVERAVYDYILKHLVVKHLIGIYAALIRFRQGTYHFQLWMLHFTDTITLFSSLLPNSIAGQITATDHGYPCGRRIF